jgi:manganese oxidase
VVTVDGATLPGTARSAADTVNVGSGQRYAVIWPARRLGQWLIHCRIPHHTANTKVEEDGAAA